MTTTCHSADERGRRPPAAATRRPRRGCRPTAPAAIGSSSGRGPRARRPRCCALSGAQSLAWRRTSSRSRSVMTSVEPGDLGSPMRRGRGTSTSNCLGDRARAGWSADHAVAEAHRLAHVVGDEHDPSIRARCQIRSSSSWRMSRVMASSAPNGSSMSRMSASCASARARATRCRIPPGQLVRTPVAEAVEVDGRSSASARVLSLASRHACEAAARARRSRGGQPREQRRLLEHQR